MNCRAKAQSVVGVTDAQRAGLSLGPEKGTNHRTGYKHREESKRKVSVANRAFWAANPEKAKERGAKHRGERAYNWKGGVSRLNTSIRQMSEMIVWQRAVKARDGSCVQCGSVEDLESHHVRGFAQLLVDLNIRNRDDARLHAAILFDVSNGKTLCASCHYTEHGRIAPALGRGVQMFQTCLQCSVRFTLKPSQVRRRPQRCCSRVCADAHRKANPRLGSSNPNWKGGPMQFECVECEKLFRRKVMIVQRPKVKFCSKECKHANRRRNIQPLASAPSSAIHEGCESGT